MESPEEVRAEFARRMQISAWDAVHYLHELELACGYLHPKVFDESDPCYFVYPSLYGHLEITINTSKPEKDPKEIFAEALTEAHQKTRLEIQPDFQQETLPSTTHCRPPQCDLCWENEGYPGDSEHPAKPGLRIVPITLQGERWGLQYSPYGYFEYHCIALDAHHVPMHISAQTFPRLFDFLDLFPFFFIGTNADLPYVGGSILSHEHMQGGKHRFALMDAPFEAMVAPTDEVCRALNLEHEVLMGTVFWPASVVRLVSPHRQDLEKLGAHILATWQGYAHPEAGIVNDPRVPGGLHNTINAIAYKDADGVYGEVSSYVLDLVLRNNVTDATHPYGVFHPDESLHHIKKENIGLIEIMGLAILPGRLAQELPLVERALIHVLEARRDNTADAVIDVAADVTADVTADTVVDVAADVAADVTADVTADTVDTLLEKELERMSKESGCDLLQHASWAQRLIQQLDPQSVTTRDVSAAMRQGLGIAFEEILAACGVFKRTLQGQEQYKGFMELFSYYI